jgi:hypothetical protein
MGIAVFCLGYLGIGCSFAAYAKRQPSDSHWYVVGPVLFVLWPALVPVVCFAVVSDWIYDRI